MKYTTNGIGIYLKGKLLANAVTPEAARHLVQLLNGPDDYLIRVYNALETNV